MWGSHRLKNIKIITCTIISYLLLFHTPAHGQATQEQIEGPTSPALFQSWLETISILRYETLNYSDYNPFVYEYVEPLFWTQSSFMQPQMMAHDRYFVDSETNTYTVDKYLDDLSTRYGGIDSVLIWPTYPNLGIDDRNQFDLIRDMPGGLAGIAGMVKQFNKAGVNVLFPYNPWDQGTRSEGVTDYVVINQLFQQTGIQGFNGDTMASVPEEFWDESLHINHPIAIEPEGGGNAVTLSYTKMGWGYWGYETIPTVDKWKWLETRHMTNICNRWAKDHTDDIQHAFFNGCGFETWESIWGIWNQLNLRDAEATRRVATIERYFKDLVVSPQWEPHTPVVQSGIYASKWPGDGEVLWTFVNRNPQNSSGKQISIPYDKTYQYFDAYHGVPLTPVVSNNVSTFSFDIEVGGYGALYGCTQMRSDFKQFLATMQNMTKYPLSYFSTDDIYLTQTQVPIERTKKAEVTPPGMIKIPANDAYEFVVNGVEIEGCTTFAIGYPASDIQYVVLNETIASCNHKGVLDIPKFYIDQYPVTNAQFLKFLQASKYVPKDKHNFLRDWNNTGTYPQGWDNKPVTWVSITDAREYATWAGKRLPNEWEWQYAMQGTDGRTYPWGNTWDATVVPTPNKSRKLTAPDDVDAHPGGASPFGVMDGVGNVWQMTNEYIDDHTRSIIYKGGSYYQAQGSLWYFPQAYMLTEHGKWLAMSDSYDRSGTVGFRCAMDAIQ